MRPWHHERSLELEARGRPRRDGALVSGDRLRARFVLRPDAYERIYGPDQRAAIEELVEVVGPPETAERVAQDPDILSDVEVLLSGWGAPLLTAELLDKAPKLRLVLYGAGAVRGFVTDVLFERAIKLSSAASANAVPVAEYTLATVLFSLKHGWRFVRRAIADPADPDRQAVPGAYHATVGLAGLGAIGRLVRERLRPFDLAVLAYDPYCSEAEARALKVSLVSLEELFARSSVVSLHVPLYEATRAMIGRDLLALMPQGATIINTARGALVRHDELAAVLAERPDLDAVLDVTDPEPLPAGHRLLELDNVVLTPHIAGSLGPECLRLGDLVVGELRRYLAGEPLAYEVDPKLLPIQAEP